VCLLHHVGRIWIGQGVDSNEYLARINKHFFDAVYIASFITSLPPSLIQGARGSLSRGKAAQSLPSARSDTVSHPMVP
jgi:hypothetical protein